MVKKVEEMEGVIEKLRATLYGVVKLNITNLRQNYKEKEKVARKKSSIGKNRTSIFNFVINFRPYGKTKERINFIHS